MIPKLLRGSSMKQIFLILVILFLPLETMANYCKLSFDEIRDEYLVSRSEEVLKTFGKQEQAKEFFCKSELCVSEVELESREIASSACR